MGTDKAAYRHHGRSYGTFVWSQNGFARLSLDRIGRRVGVREILQR